MIYLIYAAGNSLRIKENHKIEHKALLEINGLSLIEHQLSWINATDPKQIIIVVNSNHVNFISKLKDLQFKMPIKLIFNDDIVSKNMKSFYLAKDYIKNQNVTFTTSDLFCDADNIENFLNSNSTNKILIDIDKSNYTGDEVLVEIQNNIVTRCSKKISNFEGMAIGIYSFDKKFINKMLDYCEKVNNSGIFDQSLYYAIDNSISLDCKILPISTMNKLWFDIDTYEEFVNAKSKLNDK